MGKSSPPLPPPPPPPPTPYLETESGIKWKEETDTAKKTAADEVAKAERDLTTANTAAEKAAARTKYDNAVAAALELNRGGAKTALNQRGLSTDEFMPLVETELGRVRSTIPDLDPNPGGYFSSNLVDQVLGGEQTARRGKYGRDVAALFPTNYAQTTFADTADDSVLNDILGTAYGTASDALGRAKARGNLDETGYNYAVGQLGQQKTAGMSKLQRTGGDILSGYRTGLEDIGKKASTAAGSYELGGTFDPNVYKTEADTYISGKKAGLEGDIRGAVGTGDDLFNIDSLLNRAAGVQGAGNNLAQVLEERMKKRTAERGLGSTGEF